MLQGLTGRATAYLQFLCNDLPGRAIGSPGNRAATDWFAQRMADFGFEVTTPGFACMDWEEQGAELTVAGESLAVLPSPYSLGCEVRALLTVAENLEAVERIPGEGTILLLRGALAREQLMPKNYPFYNPEEHQQLIACLERKRPAAILAATGRDPGMAGGISPFPLIEDGGFEIPCAHLPEAEGERLARHAGEQAELAIRARRIPATGCNVEARKGSSAEPRVVVFAHIDAKRGTPGALDNAAGVCTLLLLAEALRGVTPAVSLELVALNGEDDYSAAGERLFLRRNEGRFHEILLGINIDGAGDRDGEVAFSLYGCPDPMAEVIRSVFRARPGMVEGPAWFQSDHSLFLMHNRPALAITSARFSELWAEIAHTERDTPDRVNPAQLESLALILRELVLEAPRLRP